MAELILTDTLPAAFATAGIPWPGDPEPDKLFRFSTNPQRTDDKAGWLRIFPDSEGAAFGCWRDGTSYTWQKKRNGHALTPAERAALEFRAAEARREAEAERERAYQSAAAKAKELWRKAMPLTADHPYLQTKRIKPHCARLGADGRLMVPVRGPDGEIQSLQHIDAEGEKRFLAGGRTAGGWALLGTVTRGAPILLAEGFATAATLTEATGHPVYCAFTAGNLMAVAGMVRERYPDRLRLVCGDDDRATPGNPGRTKATEAAEATGARLVFPELAGEAGTDFNDVAKNSGPGAVRLAVETAMMDSTGPAGFRILDWSAAERFQGTPKERAWLVQGVFPMGKAALLGAAGGGWQVLFPAAPCPRRGGRHVARPPAAPLRLWRPSDGHRGRCHCHQRG